MSDLTGDTMNKYKEYMITSFVKAVQPVVVKEARGAVVTDADGADYIDCFAGIAVVNSGHCNPEVIAAAQAQMEQLIHCCSYIYYSIPTANLAERMAQITPGALKKTFFANSGAEAIEGAMKLAKLYTGKTEFVSLTYSFHGRTLATLSVTGNAARKRRGGPYSPGVSFAPAPYAFRAGAMVDSAEEFGTRCALALEDVIRFQSADDIAAFIAEPVMGEGGIIVPPLNYFKEVKEVLDRHGILFIADEVQSGFGRTGAMFGIEHYGVEPDLMVTAKGIAAGFPLGAFTTTDEIAGAFRPGEHLSTFGGNPVSCAAALANIDYIRREKLPEKSLQDGEYIIPRLKRLQERFPVIGEVRGLGLMIGIELVTDAALTPAVAQAESIRESCRLNGVLVGVGGAYGNVVRIQPPLVITREQIDHSLHVLEAAFEEIA